MPPPGDMSMAKELQAEFSKKGSCGKRPVRPGRTRREDPPVAPPRTPKAPAPRAQQRTALPPTWSGPLLTPDDLARIDAVHSAGQKTKPTTLFSYDDNSNDRSEYSSHQTTQASPSFVQQPHAQRSTEQSMQTYTSNRPSNNPQQISPSNSGGAMSVDGDSPPPKLSALEQELFAKWNPSLVINFNGSQPKEHIPTTGPTVSQGIPLSPLAPTFSQGAVLSSMVPAPNQCTSSAPARGQDSTNRVVTSGMVSGSGLSRSRWA